MTMTEEQAAYVRSQPATFALLATWRAAYGEPPQAETVIGFHLAAELAFANPSAMRVWLDHYRTEGAAIGVTAGPEELQRIAGVLAHQIRHKSGEIQDGDDECDRV